MDLHEYKDYKKGIDKMHLVELLKENRVLRNSEQTKEVKTKILLIKNRVENIFKPT